MNQKENTEVGIMEDIRDQEPEQEMPNCKFCVCPLHETLERTERGMDALFERICESPMLMVI
jgi:hypothetical protein